MRIMVAGLISAILALIGYNIYEWISKRWLKSKQFKALANDFKFSQEVSSFIWGKAKTKLRQLVSYTKSGKEKVVSGFEIVGADDSLLADIRSGLPKDYLVFVCDFDKKKKSLGIIKGADKFSIIKIMQTNGENNNLTNAKLLSELRSLDKTQPFSITGAGYDWLELAFDALPEGSGSAEGIGFIIDKAVELSPPQDNLTEYRGRLEEELRATNSIFLWWPMKRESAEQ